MKNNLDSGRVYWIPVERMRYKQEALPAAEDAPDVGITVECKLCDKFFDKHFNENLEPAHHETTSEKVEIGKFNN